MIKLNVPRFEQTKNMCGIYSLKQIFSFFGDDISIKEIKKRTRTRKDTGTWFAQEVLLAKKRGYKVELHSNYNVVFDPTWQNLPPEKIAKKLEKRFKFKKKEKGQYIGLSDYLKMGGRISLKPINKEIIKKYLNKKIPVLVNFDVNYFRKSKRFYKGKHDDVRGDYVGHASVVAGYDKNRFFMIDPSPEAPKGGKYWINQEFLIFCILIHNPYIAAIWK